MDEFTKRMLERTRARQELINSLATEEADNTSPMADTEEAKGLLTVPGAVNFGNGSENDEKYTAEQQYENSTLDEDDDQEEETVAKRRSKLLTERTRHFLQRLGALHSLSDADDSAAVLALSSPVHPVHELVNVDDSCIDGHNKAANIPTLSPRRRLCAAEESQLAAAASKERTPGTGLSKLAKLADRVHEWQCEDTEVVDHFSETKSKKYDDADRSKSKMTNNESADTKVQSPLKMVQSKDSRKVTFAPTPPTLSSPLKKPPVWQHETTTSTHEVSSPVKSSLTKQLPAPVSSAAGNLLFKKQSQSPAKSTEKESSPFSRQLPQQQSLTVAQRRALYERNVVAGGGIPGALPSGLLPKDSDGKKKLTGNELAVENQKPVSVAAVAAKFDSATKSSTDFEDHTKPAAPTPPRPSAVSHLKQQRQHIAVTNVAATAKQQYWSPPRVKNVLLKRSHQHEIETDRTADDEVVPMASSSPSVSLAKTPDTIVMSVGRVQYTPPQPGCLYPNVSMEYDANEQHPENDLQSMDDDKAAVMFKTASKRRSDGSAVNTSSSTNDTSLVLSAAINDAVSKKVKNSNDLANKPYLQDSNQEDSLNTTWQNVVKEEAFEQSPLGLTTLGSPQHSSSFTYFGGKNIDGTATKDAAMAPSYYSTPPRNDQKQIEQQEEQKHTPLVHTVSTYRKQQQQQRRLAIKNKHTGGFRESEEDDDDDDPRKRTAEWTKKHAMIAGNGGSDSEDDSDWELDAVAERARHLERNEVPRQESVIAQATQALNLCQTTRAFGNGSPEQVHAERLLLIAGLRRNDAVIEAQRLRLERTLRPFGGDSLTGKRPLDRKLLLAVGSGRTLIIDSLCVPVLAVPGGHHGGGKSKHNNQLLTNSGHRHYVCAVRAGATARRAPLTVATRTVDTVQECVEWYAASGSDDAGYVEFIKKPSGKTKKGKETIGGPLRIGGLDLEDEVSSWKCTVEVYGLKNGGDSLSSADDTGCDHSDTKSVLDKLWSSVMTTPTKPPSGSSKKHNHYAHHIESPGGPAAVRQTAFRQLGYFVFSAGQLDRRQFTLNRVFQQHDVGPTTLSDSPPLETVRVRMRLVDADEETEEDYNEENGVEEASGSSCGKLVLPVDARQNRIEGFLTLFDDNELRRAQAKNKWHRSSSSDTNSATTAWRRLWFRMRVVQEAGVREIEGSEERKSNSQKQTIVLTYWMYPEHAEQQRQPMGSIDLGRCLKPMVTNKQLDDGLPAEFAPGDLCARPNTLRLLVYGDYDGSGSGENDEQVLLLAADTAAERREWCAAVNASVRAITEYRDRTTRLERERREREQQRRDRERRELEQQRQQKQQQQQQQRVGGFPTPGKKKKKFYLK